MKNFKIKFTLVILDWEGARVDALLGSLALGVGLLTQNFRTCKKLSHLIPCICPITHIQNSLPVYINHTIHCFNLIF